MKTAGQIKLKNRDEPFDKPIGGVLDLKNSRGGKNGSTRR
jgi:hypothetical protein